MWIGILVLYLEGIRIIVELGWIKWEALNGLEIKENQLHQGKLSLSQRISQYSVIKCLFTDRQIISKNSRKY